MISTEGGVDLPFCALCEKTTLSGVFSVKNKLRKLILLCQTYTESSTAYELCLNAPVAGRMQLAVLLLDMVPNLT